MTTILHIASSPRRKRSASRGVAEAFIHAYQFGGPQTQVATLDLWHSELPEFDEQAMAAKYAGLEGLALTPTQATAWETLRKWADHLQKADVLVLSVPLWNFGIPYKLKHFIDLVSQKDILFAFDPVQSFTGLLHNKTAVVAYARGLDFSAQSATPAEHFDFQRPYVEAWLRFVGITDIHAVTVEKTIFSSREDEAARQQANSQARQLAQQLITREGMQK